MIESQSSAEQDPSLYDGCLAEAAIMGLGKLRAQSCTVDGCPLLINVSPDPKNANKTIATVVTGGCLIAEEDTLAAAGMDMKVLAQELSGSNRLGD